jgi:signal transduction histidine kinase
MQHAPIQRAIPASDNGTSALAALAALSTTVFSSLTATLDAYLALAMQVAGTRTAFISLFEVAHQRILSVRNQNGCAVAAGSRVPLEETFCQYVRASGSPVIVEDAGRDPRVCGVATRTRFSIGAFLGVPLMTTSGSLAGTLCALDPAPRAFRQHHIHILQIIAQHLATLLEQALANANAARSSRQNMPDEDMASVLHMVAHDIRSPLSAILGNVDLMLTGFYGALSDDQREMLASVRESSRFINRLAMDLVDTAAAQVGTLSILRYRFEPAALAQAIVAACAAEAREKHLTLAALCDPDLPTMDGDADRVRQIILNLVGNALRYTTSGSVLIRVTAQPSTVIFSVEDTGPGIPAAQQETIWAQHMRASAVGTGIGLGLYIVRRLVRALGGTVGLESAPGQGSRVWVRLPIRCPARLCNDAPIAREDPN